MNKAPRKDGLEKQLRSIYAIPRVSADFVEELDAKLSREAELHQKRARRPIYLHPAWITAAVLLVAMLAAFLAIGPEKVYAEVRRLLGYIPGVGLVDSSAPIRVLAEPVEQTRDGVTITVTSAVLTADRAHIEYRVFGVQRSAYPTSESVTGCMQPEFLQLPDGSKLERTNDYPAVPADVNEAVLVIPCIANTLPGKAPEAWILPLRFVPAPPDLTVMPVQEITASPVPAVTGTAAVDSPQPETLTVTNVIETSDGYILIGKFAPAVSQGDWVQVTGMAQISDASGREVAYSIPYDIELPGENIKNGGFEWVYKINSVGVTFPVSISLESVTLLNPVPEASASLDFDTGPDPQPGQTWQVNQKVELSDHTLTLKTISADARGGYSFNFEVDPSVFGVGVEIEGFDSMGGGGGGNAVGGGKYSISRAYASLPAGKLKIILSHLTLVSEPTRWSTEWSPLTAQTDQSAGTSLPQGVCANAGMILEYAPLPATFQGSALVYEQLDETGAWGEVLYDLLGGSRTVVAREANWGSLSRDGARVVFSSPDGFQIFDIATGGKKLLTGIFGYNPRWSSNGSTIAYIGSAAEGVFIVDIETLNTVQLSIAGYESVIGWAPDDSRLYIAVPAVGGAAWQVRAVDPVSGKYELKFTIENGSLKTLNAALSPDGQWIAYRGRDNNSVYVVKTDGSGSRLLLDAPAAAASGLTWTSTGWLGVSLMQNGSDQQKVILVNPETCSGYVIENLHGYLQAISIK